MTQPHRRHHAARPQGSRQSVGLPRPGQALLGFLEPEASLFGVPQQLSRTAEPPVTTRSYQPPRPRPAADDWWSAPRSVRTRHHWATLVGIPLAVLTLGLALGVIAVVMLVAAGVPAPWEN